MPRWYVGLIPPNHLQFGLTLPYNSPPSSQPAAFSKSISNPRRRGRMRNRKQRSSGFNPDENHDSMVSLNQFARLPWSDDEHAYESRSFFSDCEPQGFRRSTDSRCSGTKSEGHVPRLARSPTRTRRSVEQSPSPPPSFHRRPLYHYIRNKASTSQSTFDCGAVPEITPKRPMTPHGAGHLSWESTKASPSCVYELNRPRLVPSITSFPRTGFSLSGETEQRMSLARVVHDGRFIFHQIEPTRKRDRIMRGLRRSFKSFFGAKVDG
jgi:hypothetical protein